MADRRQNRMNTECSVMTGQPPSAAAILAGAGSGTGRRGRLRSSAEAQSCETKPIPRPVLKPGSTWVGQQSQAGWTVPLRQTKPISPHGQERAGRARHPAEPPLGQSCETKPISRFGLKRRNTLVGKGAVAEGSCAKQSQFSKSIRDGKCCVGKEL